MSRKKMLTAVARNRSSHHGSLESALCPLPFGRVPEALDAMPYSSSYQAKPKGAANVSHDAVRARVSIRHGGSFLSQGLYCSQLLATVRFRPCLRQKNEPLPPFVYAVLARDKGCLGAGQSLS